MRRASGSRQLPLSLWPVYIFLFLCLGSATAMYYGPWHRGVVKPDDPYLFVGEDLILFCNLTSLEQQAEDSSYLYFTHNGIKIPSQYVTILTTRSIKLRYTIHKPQDGGHFVCWLRQEQTNNARTIGSQHVKADYGPVPVNDVNCTVYNWENMTCKWELGRNYHHPEFITVALVWTISDVQKDCPRGHMTNTSCTWVSEGPDGFLPGHKYIMSVVVTNTKRQITAKSTAPLRVDTNSIVKPSPVVNLHRNDSNATCLWVVWSHTDMVHDKVAFVEYVSEWRPSEWHRLEKIHFKRGPTKVEICDLTPHTEYIIRVAVRPLPRNSEDGYRSEWRYIERVRTDPSFPEVAPEICAGCYTECPCDREVHPHCRNILVYWKHIPRALRRSVIHKYLLQYRTASTEKDVRIGNNTTLYPNNSLILSLDQDSNYSLSLYAVTSKNKLSRNHSSLIIPSESSKPKGPNFLVVETSYTNGTVWTGQFDLRWLSTEDTASYTVFWCRGNTDTHICNHEEKNQVEWQEVASDSNSFMVSIASLQQHNDRPDNYMVGVARQALTPEGQLVSSGIEWADCYYHKNRKPRVPTTVDFAPGNRAGILKVTWQYNMCERSGQDVYITRFIIFYCVTHDSSSGCQGREYNTTAQPSVHSVTLNDLEQGAYYKVNMVADSEWGVSDYSETIRAQVLDAEQHMGVDKEYSIIGVILAVLVIVILILIGVCKLRRHVQKNQEKFSSSFGDLPALPADNPPTKTYYQRRPLPQPPPASVSACDTTTTSGVSSMTGTEKRQRGGKHKSITSETSLLGPEDGHDDDGKRRDKSAAGPISEHSKLLADDGVTSESVVPPLSKYDSDSGAESRYSSEDHDYASVEGGSGSAEESGTVANTHSPPQCTAPSGNPLSQGKGAGQHAKTGYVHEGMLLSQPALRHIQPEHKPAPSHAPPPPPPASTRYMQAALVSGPSSSLSSFKSLPHSQPAVRSGAGDSAQCGHQPAQLNVAMEPVSCVRAMPPPTMPYKTAQTTGGYVGSEDCTLPRRPPGTKLRQYVPSVQDAPSAIGVDPYASTTIAAFSAHIPPPPAPPPHVAQSGRSACGGETTGIGMVSTLPAPARKAAPQGYVPHTDSTPSASAYSGSSSCSEDSRVSTDSSRRCESVNGHNVDSSEPIYSPPWESKSLVPFAIDNRPLSEYMLNLPDKFFDSTLQVNDAPTTEL